MRHCRVGSGLHPRKELEPKRLLFCLRAQLAATVPALICSVRLLASLLLFVQARQFEPHISTCVGGLFPTSVVGTPSFCCSSFRSGSGEFERRTSLHPRLRDKVRMSYSEMTDMKRELSTDASGATRAVRTTQMHVTSSTQYPKRATSEPMKYGIMPCDR